MSKWPTALSCASNRSSFGLAATLLFLLSFGVLFVLTVKADHWDAPFAPVFGYAARGVTYSGFDGERLEGVQIDCGDRQSVSDTRGRFVLDLGFHQAWRCRFAAPGFEPREIWLNHGDVLAARMTPDPLWTIAQIADWERTGRFDKQYDLLHPDASRSWTREEFIRLISLTEDQPLVGFEHGAPYFLKTWDHYGEVYHHVAVVPVWLTFEDEGKLERYYWEAHLVKHDGLWRWFRETPKKISSAHMQAAGAELSSGRGPAVD